MSTDPYKIPSANLLKDNIIIEKRIKWYHLTALGISILGMSLMGVLNIIDGASLESRFYIIDDIVIRFLGAGFVLIGLLLSLRRNWVFISSILIFVFSILEAMITYDIDKHSGFHNITFLIFTFILFGVPIIILSWLRSVFTK